MEKEVDPHSSFPEHFEIEHHTSFEDFTEDDSVKDKDYIEETISSSDSRSEISRQGANPEDDEFSNKRAEIDKEIKETQNRASKTEEQEESTTKGNNLEEQKSNSRKKQRRPDTWKRNIKKEEG